jgi:probable rRNA maturation factor
MKALNATWRGLDKPTNVLSFPNQLRGPEMMLGDIAVSFQTVQTEARAENKPFAHHYQHMVVHGLLHLLGFDHEDAIDADEMEAVERRSLARLSVPDPYRKAKPPSAARGSAKRKRVHIAAES